MTRTDFENLKPGTKLYDTILSKRKRRHITAIVQQHNKDKDSLQVLCEGLEEDIPYRDHLLFEFMPKDKSSLPFY